MATGDDWTSDEIGYAIADYFEMLTLELAGQAYNKTSHRELLLKKLKDRSSGSIEYKHQNTSAVLIEMGMPHINGYKAAANYQSSLRDKIIHYLGDHSDTLNMVEKMAEAVPNEISYSLNTVEVAPPVQANQIPASPIKKNKQSTKFDFVAKDAQNHKLGKIGEEFVLKIVKERLHKAGRSDLAGMIEWTSETNDGAGYDIKAFETNGNEIYIEVKTTNCKINFPFLVSSNEVECSEIIGDRYRIYRVFSFSTKPQFFVLKGCIKNSCHLQPAVYKALPNTE